MSQTITAIYEDGVLKPELPLQLEEHDRVQLTVSPVPVPSPFQLLSPEEKAVALERMWSERTPISPSIPRPTRDELYDRN